MEPDEGQRARAPHPPPRRSHPRARRRARRPGDARQRQAAGHRAGGRRRAGRRPVPLHVGLGDQARGQHDPDLGALHARRAVSRLHVAGPGRRRRPDHPLELPAADGGVEARSGPHLRRDRRAQAGRADTAVGPATRRARARGRHPAGSGQRRAGLRRDRRRRAGGAPRRRQGGVHRLDRGRQAHPAGRGRQPEEGVTGARRQVAEHRVRRRRPRDGDPGRGQRDLLQPRPVLLRRLAAVCRRAHLRRGRGWA